MWSPANGGLPRSLEDSTSQVKKRVRDLAILPTGELASASGYNSEGNANIKIWNVLTGKIVRELVGHTNLIYKLVVLPNGEIVSSSFDNTIRIWSTKTWKVTHILRTTRPAVRLVV